MSKLTDLLNDPAAEKRYASLATAYDPVSPGRNILFPISSHGFSALPTDGVSNAFFAPRIDGLPIFERALFSQGKLSGSSSSPETSLVAIAADGAIDYFYDFAWAGRRFELYLGGEGFAFNEYGLVIILVQQDPTYTDTTITIPLRDISFLTDAEIQSARYQGTGGAEGSGEVGGKLKPEAWGFCPHVQPIYLGLDANGRHQFGVGSGPIVGVLQVWDRASPLLYAANPASPQPGEYIVDVSTGTITLGGAFNGPIQADVLGRRYLSVPSPSTIAFDATVKNFAVTAGPPEPQFSVGMKVRCLLAADPAGTWLDGIVTGTRPGGTISVIPLAGQSTGLNPLTSWIICPWGTPAGILCAMSEAVFGTTDYTDTAARVALNNVQPATCGYWVPEGGNAKQLLDLVAEGTGCLWFITRFNTFRVGRIDLPSGEPVASYDSTSILSIERVSTDEPTWQVVLNWGKRWSTLNDDQVAGVANRLKFTEEWEPPFIGEDDILKSIYRSDNRIKIDTIFQDFYATQSELFRQFNIFSFPRKDYFKITQRRDIMSLGLGNVISVQYPRYGLSAGKLFTIVDIKEDYNTGIVEMGVWG
ncbi:MAG: hypothetical protein WAP03_10170 [Methylorubrum rhodinum]|uniref:hypothetical protein n=1 Tax=Methylorubrum rhodinum TaxID=29428 RepID=UPI003BB03EB7